MTPDPEEWDCSSSCDKLGMASKSPGDVLRSCNWRIDDSLIQSKYWSKGQRCSFTLKCRKMTSSLLYILFSGVLTLSLIFSTIFKLLKCKTL